MEFSAPLHYSSGATEIENAPAPLKFCMRAWYLPYLPYQAATSRVTGPASIRRLFHVYTSRMLTTEGTKSAYKSTHARSGAAALIYKI